MTNRHPSEEDLALLAGGDCGRVQTFLLKRHVSRCGDCQDTLASFGELRVAVHELALPEVAASQQDWNRLAGEMRANIRLGLAAGECVGDYAAPAPVRDIRDNDRRRLQLPRLSFALATVTLLIGAGYFLHALLPPGELPAVVHAAEVESTGKGVQVRTSSGSMTLMNQSDATPDQTVTSQGAIRASYVDGNTGTVTITSVYVE